MMEVIIVLAFASVLGVKSRFKVPALSLVLGVMLGIVSMEKISADFQAFKEAVIMRVTNDIVNGVNASVSASVDAEVPAEVTVDAEVPAEVTVDAEVTNKVTNTVGDNELKTMARETAKKYGIYEELFLAVITQESAWNPQAESPKGARGLGQVMPFNAAKCDMTEEDLWIPQCNLTCSAIILSEALNYWKGAIDHALAEYNAGRDAVKNRNALTEFKETRRYVARIRSIMQSYTLSQCDSKACLRMKEDAQAGGKAEQGLYALATLIQSNVSIIYFSAFNDDYEHLENGHKDGRALDFTIPNKAASQLVVKQVNAIGEQAGVTLRILDEYKNPSPKATAGHIHVEFFSIEDAQMFLNYAMKEGEYKNV